MNEYLRNLQKSEMEVLKMRGDFEEIWRFGQLVERKSNDVMQNGKSKAIIPDMQDTIKYTPLRVVGAISGCPGRV